MLDDLRNSTDPIIEDNDSDMEFYDPGDLDDGFEDTGGGLIFGMSAPQRFVIAVMVLLIVCVLGAGCLILTERMVLPLG
jgi:hypothetical protein